MIKRFLHIQYLTFVKPFIWRNIIFFALLLFFSYLILDTSTFNQSLNASVWLYVFLFYFGISISHSMSNSYWKLNHHILGLNNKKKSKLRQFYFYETLAILFSLVMLFSIIVSILLMFPFVSTGLDLPGFKNFYFLFFKLFFISWFLLLLLSLKGDIGLIILLFVYLILEDFLQTKFSFLEFSPFQLIDRLNPDSYVQNFDILLCFTYLFLFQFCFFFNMNRYGS